MHWKLFGGWALPGGREGRGKNKKGGTREETGERRKGEATVIVPHPKQKSSCATDTRSRM